MVRLISYTLGCKSLDAKISASMVNGPIRLGAGDVSTNLIGP